MANKTIADALAAIFTKKIMSYVLTALVSSALTYAVSHGWIEQTVANDLAQALTGLINALTGGGS